MKPIIYFALPVSLCLLFATGCDQRQSVALPPPAVIQPMPVQPADSSAAATLPSGVSVDEPSGTPLPESAYRCTISLSGVPAKMKTGEKAAVKVSLANDSTSIWPKYIPGRRSDLAVNVGYHWVDAQPGAEEKEGPVRAELPENLAPGMSAKLDLVLTAPAPGAWTLRVEPVHETIAWFSWKKGCAAKAKILVTP
jgi:hypothetical protein